MNVSTLRLPKINNGSGLIYYMLLYVFFMALAQTVGAPHFIVFLLDGLNIILFIMILTNKNIQYAWKLPIVKYQLFTMLIGIIVSILNGTNFILFIWALRNYARFIIFFSACVICMKQTDAQRIILFLKQLYFINFIIFMIQFFVLRIDGDRLGGIFGTIEGCNGYSNVYLVGMTVVFFFEWAHGEITNNRLLLYVMIALLQSALGEIKVYYVELVILIAIIFIKVYFIDKTKRKILNFLAIFFALVIALFLGLTIIGILRPEFNHFFTFEKIIEIISNDKGYSQDGKSINRLNAISTINKIVLSTPKDRLFGLGLGAAEYSQSSELLTSSFYHVFSVLRYKNFLISWMYIELGYVGLILYCLSFALTIKDGMNRLKKEKDTSCRIFIMSGITITMFCYLLILYGTALRIDCGYLVYFFVSMAYLKGDKAYLTRKSTN